MASPLLENLNPEQLAAVTLPHASALILAGAGSGKTRVLTTRIAWLLATGQAGPLSVLAVTFTNKAAKEMLLRLSALTPVNTRGMWVGTFHGLCNRMLRAHHRDADLPQLFQILDTQDQLSLIKRMYRAHNLDDNRYPPKQLQWFIADAKEEGLRPNMVEASDELSRRQVEHYAMYDAMCQREGVVDFAELMLRSYELLAGNEGIREHYRRRSRICSSTNSRIRTRCNTSGCACWRDRTRPCSRWATTTSRSTRSAAPRSPTCSSSSATSPRRISLSS
jgi:DNA helicase-2/ATP-dependent DNA helicase PcrA